VSPVNPHGDCEEVCGDVPYDSLTDTEAVLAMYYEASFDMVSAHWYSCLPPYVKALMLKAQARLLCTVPRLLAAACHRT
jgi:hypothetical protein